MVFQRYYRVNFAKASEINFLMTKRPQCRELPFRLKYLPLAACLRGPSAVGLCLFWESDGSGHPRSERQLQVRFLLNDAADGGVTCQGHRDGSISGGNAGIRGKQGLQNLLAAYG